MGAVPSVACPVRSGAKPLLGPRPRRAARERPKGPERAETLGAGREPCRPTSRRPPVQPPTGAGDGRVLYAKSRATASGVPTTAAELPGNLTRREAVAKPAPIEGKVPYNAWPSHSSFPGRAARPSAWARSWPRLCRRARGVRGGRRGAGPEALRHHVRGPLETLTLTENAQPALMAVSLAVMRVLESRRASASPARSSSWPATRSANIPRWPPPGRCQRRRCRAASEDPRAGHAGGRAGRAGRHGGAAGRRQGGGREARRRSRAGRGLPARQRQRADAGRHLRRQDRRRPRRAARQGARRAPLHAAQRQRPLPLRADAAGRRCHGARRWRASRCKPPAVPLIANVLAAPITDPAEIKQRLVEQVTGTVRWRECVAAHGRPTASPSVYEIGSGKVLAGLAKRIAPTLNATSDRHAAGHRSRAAALHAIERTAHVRA